MEEGLLSELHEDHEMVKELLEKLENVPGRSTKNRDSLFEKLRQELVPHLKAEEKVFYPVLADRKNSREDALEALEEHHVTDMVFKELDKTSKTDEKWKAKLLVFKEIVNHHIEEEESKIFQHAREEFDDEEMSEIFEEFQNQKENLKNRLKKKAAA